MSDLDSSVKHVRDKSTFIVFLRELIIDYQNNQTAWENRTLGEFLESMGGWLEDMDLEEYYQRIDASEVMQEPINWRVFADVLVAATLYE
jgi:hypothetical protein